MLDLVVIYETICHCLGCFAGSFGIVTALETELKAIIHADRKFAFSLD